jgi:hypothetical protein
MRCIVQKITKFFVLLGCGLLFATALSLVHVFLTWLFLLSVYYLGGINGLITWITVISFGSAVSLYFFEKR